MVIVLFTFLTIPFVSSHCRRSVGLGSKYAYRFQYSVSTVGLFPLVTSLGFDTIQFASLQCIIYSILHHLLVYSV